MSRVVHSDAEADAILASLDAALSDARPFFEMLERPSGALEVGMREIWVNRFGIGIRLQDSTIEARASGRGYYRNPKGPLATRSAPVFYWTGSELRAASFFTEIDEHTALIDPDRNYQGPLEGVVTNPFSDIVGSTIPDDNLWDDTLLGDRIRRDLSAYLFKALES